MGKHIRSRTRPAREPVATRITDSLQAARGSLRTDLFAFGVLLVATLLVFGQTLTFGFVNWDDPTNIIENPDLLLDRPGRLLSFWKAPYADLYVPLVYTSYLLDLKLSGGAERLFSTAWPRAPVFHADNLLLHWVAGCGLFALVRRLVAGGWRFGLAGALLFIVHPLQAESVSWITGRKDVLSGALAILALSSWTAWLQSGRNWRYIVSTALFLGAILSKPSVVILPLMAASIAWYLTAPARKWAPWLVPWLLVALVSFIVTRGAQNEMENAEFIVPAWQRLFVVSDTVLFYFRKLIVPFGLVPLYERTNMTLFAGGWIWLSPLVLIGLLFFIYRSGRKARVSGLLFLLPLLPVSGLLPFFYQLLSNVADRYAYLSLVGAALALAFTCQWAAVRWRSRKNLQMILSGILILFLAGLCFRQVTFWRDSGTLWKRQLAILPDSTMGNYLLGRHYLSEGALDAARDQYLETIRRHPAFADSYNDLLALAEQMEDRGLQQTTARLALDNLSPGSPEKQIARGRAFLVLEQYHNAAESYRLAVSALPDDAEAQRNLALSLLRINDLDGASQAAEAALKVDPRSLQARDIYAVALFKQGRAQEAAEQMSTLVEMDPDNQEYRQKLSAMQRAAGRPAE